MYNFNYFSPYIKPKSKKGYYLGISLLAIGLAVGILVGITVFMKMKIKEKEDQIAAITAEISNPTLAAEIAKGLEFGKKLVEVNKDKMACEMLNNSIPYMNAVDVPSLTEINKMLTEDALVLSMTFSPDEIDLEMASRYENYTTVAQLMENFRKSQIFTDIEIPNLNDPFNYGEPNAFQYLTFPLKLYHNGGSRR